MNSRNLNQPIGIFDSGIGGTSIWKEIRQLLPNEDTIYLSDSKNSPYGHKTPLEILELSKKNTEYLLSKHCKLIVVACNTATTNAISYLREHYDIPIIGIEPAIKPAALQTKTNKVGILATKGTLNSHLFENTSSKITSEITIFEQEGEGLVKLIEAGKIESEEMEKLLRFYLTPMLDQNIDCLVLGCTHYPYLIKTIRKIIGPTIKIIDSGEAVAKQTKRVLLSHQLINLKTSKGYSKFYINKNKNVLTTILSNYSEAQIENVNF